MRSLHILLLEPYFTGSHKAWATELGEHSRHNIQLLTMSGHHWKWRMHGGAITLARQFMEQDLQPDLILATDMLDLTTFLAHTRSRTANIPTAIYFHENQLAYPWSATNSAEAKQRDNHYPFINFTSALAADRLFFNSQYNMDSFLGGLPKFLKGFPDHHELNSIEKLKAKSSVLPLGLDLKQFDGHQKGVERNGPPLIVWNHRWEHDKDPASFFSVLDHLATLGMPFEVALLGEHFSREPAVFVEAKERLGNRIVQYGYAPTFEEYAQWLWKADIIPVTSNQDFFGASLVQAMYCQTYPLLPNRLAFPEHIPGPEGEAFYYKDEDELLHQLKTAIQNIETVRSSDVAQYVDRYDWNNLIDAYDQAMLF